MKAGSTAVKHAYTPTPEQPCSPRKSYTNPDGGLQQRAVVSVTRKWRSPPEVPQPARPGPSGRPAPLPGMDAAALPPRPGPLSSTAPRSRALPLGPAPRTHLQGRGCWGRPAAAPPPGKRKRRRPRGTCWRGGGTATAGGREGGRERRSRLAPQASCASLRSPAAPGGTFGGGPERCKPRVRRPLRRGDTPRFKARQAAGGRARGRRCSRRAHRHRARLSPAGTGNFSPAHPRPVSGSPCSRPRQRPVRTDASQSLHERVRTAPAPR